MDKSWCFVHRNHCIRSTVIKSHVVVCFLCQYNIRMRSRQQNKRNNMKIRFLVFRNGTSWTWTLQPIWQRWNFWFDMGKIQTSPAPKYVSETFSLMLKELTSMLNLVLKIITPGLFRQAVDKAKGRVVYRSCSMQGANNHALQSFSLVNKQNKHWWKTWLAPWCWCRLPRKWLGEYQSLFRMDWRKLKEVR